MAVALCFGRSCLALDGAYHLLPAAGYSLNSMIAAVRADALAQSDITDAAPVELPDAENRAEPTLLEPPATPPRLHLLWAGLISAGVVGGTAYNSFTDGPTGSYNFAHEGWFGENTYIGGGDKVSHFVSFEIIALELATVYQYLGFSPEQSVIGGFAVSSLAGLVNEIGDGANKYGFSYEDLIADTLGAGTAALIYASRTRDLFGFRFGLLPGPVFPKEAEGIGRDYSHEIYSADVKLAGLARRLHMGLGLARFLLVSTTWGVSGYPYASPDQRQRLIGLELGLNFQEMLYAVHVYDDTWWGIALHTLIDNFRVPYTQIGFRYDINHGNWYGPAVGGTTM